jgi:hypothetical protein
MKALAATMVLLSIILTQLDLFVPMNNNGGDFISGFVAATAFVGAWALIDKARELYAQRSHTKDDDPS